MNILQGLKIIDRAKLPHPEWEFVRSSKDLKRFSKIKDYIGWTIRTVDIKNSPWKNIYTNWLAKRDVPHTVDEFQKKLGGRALFVIYPSWKWRKAGTVLIEKERVIIEAIRGAIVDLMRHGKVDISYFFQKGKLVGTAGNTKLLTPAERKMILQAPKKLKQKDVILEWGITT